MKTLLTYIESCKDCTYKEEVQTMNFCYYGNPKQIYEELPEWCPLPDKKEVELVSKQLFTVRI